MENVLGWKDGYRLPPREESLRLSAHGKVLIITRCLGGDWHACIVGQQSFAGGPSGTRFGNAREIREDIAHFQATGALPRSTGKSWA